MENEIQLSKEGASEAFKEFIQPEIPVLLRVARSLTGSTADAEDLVQDTLIRAFRALHTFDGQHPRAWLLTILRNSSHNEWRKKRPVLVEDWTLIPQETPAFGAELPESAEETVLRTIVNPDLLAAVQALDERYRATLLLIDVEGFSYAECAEILGVPLGTVMSRLSRARSRVRKALMGSTKRIDK